MISGACQLPPFPMARYSPRNSNHLRVIKPQGNKLTRGPGWAHPCLELAHCYLWIFSEFRKLRETKAEGPRDLAIPSPPCTDPGPVLGPAKKPSPTDLGWMLPAWCSGEMASLGVGLRSPSPLPPLCTAATSTIPGRVTG